MIQFEKTIAAISSGQTPAAIGIVRMTGSHALTIISKCLHNSSLRPRTMHARTLFDVRGNKIDDVLVCWFKAPNSFTGEDSVEIYAHGGLVNLSRVLNALCEAGAAPAEPGEFSKRAFLNGKLDLAQAEAIMDVIHAQNEMQCSEAQRQLSGSVSKSVSELRACVLSLLCAIEATIDFSAEEELAPMPVDRIRNESQILLDQIDRMKRAHEQYRAGGFRTVFVGQPNAGKSSLFNTLLGHERAIVTQIAGTTTDTIESTLNLQQQTFCLIDTAGITDSDNPIESLGIERTRDQIMTADILVVLFDGCSADDNILAELNERCTDALNNALQNKKLMLVRTKADLKDRPKISNKINDFAAQNDLTIYDISVINRQGLAEFENALVRTAQNITSHFENVTLITSQRHISHLNNAAAAIRRSLDSLNHNMPAECIAADLHDAAQQLSLITGEFASEDIINEIFSHFCIGK